MRLVFAVAAIAVLTGCATGYQKQGVTGGFDETQLDRNVYRVSFKGNGFTSPERAADLVLLRCAELTLSNGYKYFAIVDSQHAVRQSTYTTPTQSYTTGTATGSAHTMGNTVYGSAVGTSQTTTYGGQTIVVSKPSATNTIVMVRERSEISGYTYDAQFLQTSLGSKYGVAKEESRTPSATAPSASSRLTPDERMSTCNQRAGTLKGEERMQFMKQCLANLAR